MAVMIRKNIIIDDAMWGDVVEWRFSQRMNTESEALRNLIGAGLHYYRLAQDESFAMVEQQAMQRLGLGGAQGVVENIAQETE